MQRRDLLKALVAIPTVLVPVGGVEAALVKIEKGKHVMFVDRRTFDLMALSEAVSSDDPLAGALIIGVELRDGQTFDDVLRIYHLED
jgi:hypothetical protein